VPDSEGEEETAPEQNGRGKSPFDQVIGAAKRVIINAPAAATYYVRQRSREPDEPVAVNGSYDYEEEERDVQQNKRAAAANHKRNRMSTDNKAYKPSTSDLESDEDFIDDDGKKKRRKKKRKESVGGPLTSLPVAGYDKRKKKPKRGSKGNAGEVDEGSDSDSHATDKVSWMWLTIYPMTDSPSAICTERVRAAAALATIHPTRTAGSQPRHVFRRSRAGSSFNT
jgi:SUN domain-containing protein 1/2